MLSMHPLRRTTSGQMSFVTWAAWCALITISGALIHALSRSKRQTL
jgi:hypothetical protein